MIYTVHMPQGPQLESFERAAFIPEGRAFWALAFPPLWLLIHRLWWPFVFYMAAVLILLLLLATPYWAFAPALSALPALYLWLEGHQLRRGKLEAAGWRAAGVVEADDEDVAQERFFAAWPKDGDPLPPPSPEGIRMAGAGARAADDDLAIGLFPEPRD